MFVQRSRSGSGYTVIATGSGEEACQLAADRGAPIDLLGTDVVMPRRNGTGLPNALRRENPNLKVIFMSGYTNDTLSQHTGVDGTRFLQKPFAPVALARVRQLLDAGRTALTVQGIPETKRPLTPNT